MATRSLATNISAPAPTGLREDDYRTFCAALESTQRGRDFLAEYARRNRNADTEMLLDSLDRIETMMKAEGKARDRLQDELRVLLIAIRLARPDINSATALTKAARLVDLLDLMEQRIDAMVENKDLPPIAEEPFSVPAALTVVPQPDEPELSIPTVTSLQGPVIALVQEPARVVIKPAAEIAPHALSQEEAPRQEAVRQEAHRQELAQPGPLKQEAPKQEPTQPQPSKQELQPHEWAQLEILNQPRPKTNTQAEPYELWDEPAAETASVPLPALAPQPSLEPASAPEKWLPDFGGEAQIIHTKPVTAAAFMPEVTFMAPVARPAATGTKAETKAEPAVIEAVAAVVTAAAETVASPVARAKAVPPRVDPLAVIVSLSEAERIALFT
jgi:hypothetical protein